MIYSQLPHTPLSRVERLSRAIGRTESSARALCNPSLFVTPHLVQAMNLPDYLNSRWRGKRFNSFNRVLRDRFSARVYKIGLRLDFTCPNRDGKVAVGGCIYCNNASHTPLNYQPRTSVTAQLAQGALALRKRHKAEKFIAYFQSYSNTYDSVAKLASLYREALDFPGVVGLATATRPDCLGDDILDLLGDLSQHTYLWLEVGLESMYDRTLAWVNRGHTLNDFIDAVERAKRRQLRICTHLILGFPGENRAEILATPALLNRLGIDGVKLHNLHVIKNTQLERFYRLGQVPLFSRDEYVDLMIDFVERLDPEMVVHRLSGEAQRAITVAPEWSVDKRGVHNAIVKAFDARDTWQGRFFSLDQDTIATGVTWSQGATL
jgi:radical SAM protein (TIGR01212 family)